jgi:hypothetical protein
MTSATGSVSVAPALLRWRRQWLECLGAGVAFGLSALPFALLPVGLFGATLWPAAISVLLAAFLVGAGAWRLLVGFKPSAEAEVYALFAGILTGGLSHPVAALILAAWNPGDSEDASPLFWLVMGMGSLVMLGWVTIIVGLFVAKLYWRLLPKLGLRPRDVEKADPAAALTKLPA